MADDLTGRLALRIEGDHLVAYYAEAATMEGAVQLGCIHLAVVEKSLPRRLAFQALMQEAVGDIIKEATGKRPIWPQTAAPPPTVPPGLDALEYRKMLDELTKDLIAKGQLIEAGFAAMRALAMHPDSPQDQVDAMHQAFFGGAHHVFASMMHVIGDDAEPSDDDMRHLDQIHAELRAFIADFSRRHGLPAEAAP